MYVHAGPARDVLSRAGLLASHLLPALHTDLAGIEADGAAVARRVLVQVVALQVVGTGDRCARGESDAGERDGRGEHGREGKSVTHVQSPVRERRRRRTSGYRALPMIRAGSSSLSDLAGTSDPSSAIHMTPSAATAKTAGSAG